MKVPRFVCSIGIGSSGRFSSARLSARSVVCVTSREHLREQTATAVRHAHSAVNERLKLDLFGNGVTYRADLGEGQLSRKNES